MPRSCEGGSREQQEKRQEFHAGKANTTALQCHTTFVTVRPEVERGWCPQRMMRPKPQIPPLRCGMTSKKEAELCTMSIAVYWALRSALWLTFFPV